MSLACRKFNGYNDRPWLVWLHGLLGCGDEWLPLVNLCAQHPSLVIDLPGHGDSTDVRVKDLLEMSCLLSETLAEQRISQYWLIGYSLGGRIAMHHACYGDIRGLCGLLIEGGNPGLFSQQERNNRLEHDRNWAGRFRSQPIEQVLSDWYQQPVFSDLLPEQRQQLIKVRRHNNGDGVANMLENTSLGHQPWLVPVLQQLTLPFVYLCGENDKKFQHLAKRCALPLQTIPRVGHNAHRANAVAFAAVVNHFLSLFNKEYEYDLPERRRTLFPNCMAGLL
ncbi:2-succinyl-6-hydroxy-2,4-cyclohexadiene-1-carboxylate synthase [Photorhabdus sp. RW14-46]|uniref:2-succinyl-6-hydroxy-2, 4-cyclohexadiene-1-carboxylate synthase n=1 Tax=Photorhabdus sp. RW14-46 TaxID=2100168 RepID=UPI0013F4A716|nr:2-succinyl-6-hydroxy-2,4-cyclohexadiene-1-carboxylate synthase [Photorhabdus sp. RW14-46]